MAVWKHVRCSTTVLKPGAQTKPLFYLKMLFFWSRHVLYKISKGTSKVFKINLADVTRRSERFSTTYRGSLSVWEPTGGTIFRSDLISNGKTFMIKLKDDQLVCTTANKSSDFGKAETSCIFKDIMKHSSFWDFKLIFVFAENKTTKHLIKYFSSVPPAMKYYFNYEQKRYTFELLMHCWINYPLKLRNSGVT